MYQLKGSVEIKKKNKPPTWYDSATWLWSQLLGGQSRRIRFEDSLCPISNSRPTWTIYNKILSPTNKYSNNKDKTKPRIVYQKPTLDIIKHMPERKRIKKDTYYNTNWKAWEKVSGIMEWYEDPQCVFAQQQSTKMWDKVDSGKEK